MPKLKELREESVLSQRELARMANLAYGTVWRIENGFSEVHPATIRKLAECPRGGAQRTGQEGRLENAQHQRPRPEGGPSSTPASPQTSKPAPATP